MLGSCGAFGLLFILVLGAEKLWKMIPAEGRPRGFSLIP